MHSPHNPYPLLNEPFALPDAQMYLRGKDTEAELGACGVPEDAERAEVAAGLRWFLYQGLMHKVGEYSTLARLTPDLTDLTAAQMQGDEEDENEEGAADGVLDALADTVAETAARRGRTERTAFWSRGDVAAAKRTALQSMCYQSN